MIRMLLVSWLVLAVALGVAAWAIDDVTIEGGTAGLFWVAAIFGLVNGILGPLLQLLSLPLTLVTFGLFAIVVNGVVFAITAGLTDYLDVGGFWWTIVAALVVSLVSTILQLILKSVFAPDDV